MLQTLRNNTRIILWVTVVAFVGLIVLVWGADLRIGGVDPGTVGKVNGQPISYQIYQRVLNDNLRNFRSTNERDLTFEDERRMRDQAWDLLVNEVLIAQEAQRLGLPVTDDEVVFWIRSNPPTEAVQSPRFQDESGNFDFQQYLTSLREQPTQWVWYENRVRRQLPSDKLRQLVLYSAKVTKSEVDDYVRDQSEQRVISYVRVNPADFEVDSDAIADEEIEAYYQEHLDQFMSGDQAVLRYVRIDKAASDDDEAAAVEDLQGYQEEIGQDLQISPQKGRATFAAMAASFSDGAQADAGGSWGEPRARDSIRPPELAEQVFATPVGAVSEPFRAGATYYLVMVTAEDSLGARSFSTIERRLQAGPEQLAALRDRARDLARQGRKSGLASAAGALGLEVQETAPFTAAGFLPEFLGWRAPIDFAFQNEPGALGGPDETADAWLVYEVAERIEPLPLPFEQVKNSVKRRLVQARQRERARAQAATLVQAVRDQGLEAGARAVRMTVEQSPRFTRRGSIAGIGPDADLTAAAFALAPQAVSDLLETDTGFYIVQADSLISPSAEEAAATRSSARQFLERDRQLQVFQSWLEGLRQAADVTDYRDQL